MLFWLVFLGVLVLALWKTVQVTNLRAAQMARRGRIIQRIRERLEPFVKRSDKLRFRVVEKNGAESFFLEVEVVPGEFRFIVGMDVYWDAKPVEKVFYVLSRDTDPRPADMIELSQVLDRMVESVEDYTSPAPAYQH